MSGTGIVAEWIAADWGTSHLRVWAMRGREALAADASDRGMGALSSDGYEAALMDLVSGWLGPGRTRVVVCGMAGSKQGWAQAPYVPVPSPPVGGAPARPKTTDRRLDVFIVPGLSQKSPPDVMRGEETQIAGYLAADPDFDGVLCLPGTHTKWVRISAGEVVSFRTAMTGELFALLSKSSVLRHGIGAGWDDGAFAEAVSDSIAKPEALAAQFFSIRAAGLLSGLPPDDARARLSGLLIGAELAAMRPYWLGLPVTLIGDPALSRIYAAALAEQGAAPATADASAATLAGLAAAHARLKETQP